MSEQTRPQTIKKARTVEIKTALPWTLIVLFIVAFASFVYGWTARSGQMVTRSEITAEVMQQLGTKDTEKKAEQ